jgi:hypothetical protein
MKIIDHSTTPNLENLPAILDIVKSGEVHEYHVYFTSSGSTRSCTIDVNREMRSIRSQLIECGCCGGMFKRDIPQFPMIFIINHNDRLFWLTFDRPSVSSITLSIKTGF